MDADNGGMTVYDPFRHHRRSIRLAGYDYTTSGVYFVTCCTRNRECVFGDVIDGAMEINALGRVVVDTWNALPSHYPDIILDEMQLMPNHLHANLVVVGKRHALSEVVRGLKTFSARRINALRGSPGVPVWQRNYYEHIVRNDDELHRTRQYIRSNPLDWENDPEHP